jgi:hypothetical protein
MLQIPQNQIRRNDVAWVTEKPEQNTNVNKTHKSFHKWQSIYLTSFDKCVVSI